MSDAEVLVDLADSLLIPKSSLCEALTPLSDYQLAIVKTAMDLRKSIYVFRSIAESWSLERINRELY